VAFQYVLEVSFGIRSGLAGQGRAPLDTAPPPIAAGGLAVAARANQRGRGLREIGHRMRPALLLGEIPGLMYQTHQGVGFTKFQSVSTRG